MWSYRKHRDKKSNNFKKLQAKTKKKLRKLTITQVSKCQLFSTTPRCLLINFSTSLQTAFLQYFHTSLTYHLRSRQSERVLESGTGQVKGSLSGLPDVIGWWTKGFAFIFNDFVWKLLVGDMVMRVKVTTGWLLQSWRFYVHESDGLLLNGICELSK